MKKITIKNIDEDIYMETYDYMSTTQKQMLVIIERMSDIYSCFENNSNDLAFAKFIENARKLGIYFVAGFYPGDELKSRYETVKVFGPDKTQLFFGGRYDKQGIDDVPREYAYIDEEKQYNSGFMRYKDKYYPIVMPCGIIKIEEKPEDDRDIFS